MHDMSFLWYDYETSGRDPRRHRPVQFAGVRTDANLKITGEPVVCYCRPAPDLLPEPGASLVHGFSPSYLEKHGLSEAAFACTIHQELAQPGTCAAGYNAIRFDHEHTRFLFYRNLLDPYAWHWEHGNTRWDVIDLFRAAYALRPEGIAWPMREDGRPSFRLQDLAKANGIGGHGAAHEALADVRSMIDLVRIARDKQPKLFDWALQIRDKNEVVGIMRQDRFVWVKSLFQGRGCAAPVFRLGEHPDNPNAAIVFDLTCDPSEFSGRSPEALRNEIFSPGSRSPIFVVKANRCPFVAPYNVLTGEVMDRLGLDKDALDEHSRALRGDASLRSHAIEAYARPPDEVRPAPDADQALYEEMTPDEDRDILARLRDEDWTFAAASGESFRDSRIDELVFRYRARNFFSRLEPAEQDRWRKHCRDRHLAPVATSGEDGRTALDAWRAEIADLRRQCADAPDKVALLDDMERYGRRLEAWLDK